MQRNSVILIALGVTALLVIALSGCSEQTEQQTEGPAATAAEPAAEVPAPAAQGTEAPAAEAHAGEPEWKNMKQEAKAAKIDNMADEALEQLFTEYRNAKGLYEKAYGWAAFDNLKLALGVSGGGGNGVAVNKATGARTYMKMGTGGVGLGLGADKYQLVFLFQDAATFDNFVEKGWQADAGATAAAGNKSAEVKTDFVNGLAIYQMTEKGLMLNADIAGTKYWKNKKLND